MKETVLCKSSAVSRKFLFEMKHIGAGYLNGI